MSTDPGEKHLLLILDILPESRASEHRRARMLAGAALKLGWRVTVLAAKSVELDSRVRGDAWARLFAGFPRARLRTIWGGISAASLIAGRARLNRIKGGPGIIRLLQKLDLAGYGLWLLCACAELFFLKFRPTAILMASFPYSSHFPGFLLSKLWHIPLIVDTGDGWVVDDEEPLALLNQTDEELRRQGAVLLAGLKRAEQIWCPSKSIAAATAEAFPGMSRDQFVEVFSGYDQNDAVRDNKPVTFSERSDESFLIGYAGRFRPGKSPVEPLLDALQKIRKEQPDLYRRIRVRVWDGGPHDDLYGRYLRLAVDRGGHTSQFEILDGVPEPELIKLLDSCDVLYVAQSDETATLKRLPAKLFTYLSTLRPILATCGDSGELARFITESGAGFFHTPADTDGLSSEILRLFAARKPGADSGVRRNPAFLKPYSLQEGVFPLIGQLLDGV